MLKQGSLLNDRYYLATDIGEGSFGTVFKAFDFEKKQHVAIKLPKISESFEFMLNEFRAAQKLRSSVFAKCLEYSGKRGTHGADALVFEFIDGIDVHSWLKFTEQTYEDYYSRIFKLLRQITDGLQEAHTSGVFHRDLHSENILIDREKNTPRILDFGLSSIKEHLFKNQNITNIVEEKNNALIIDVFGSTEILRGRVRMDISSAERQLIDFHQDIYSFGFLIYSLLGEKEWIFQNYVRKIFIHDDPENDVERLEAALGAQKYNSALLILAWRCMHPNIDKRPTSMTAVSELLVKMTIKILNDNSALDCEQYNQPDIEPLTHLGHFETLEKLLDCLKSYIKTKGVDDDLRFDGLIGTGERDEKPHALVTFDYEGKIFGINNDSDMEMVALFCHDLESTRQFGNLNPEEVLIEDVTFEGLIALRLKRNFIETTKMYFSNGFFCYHPHFE